MSATWQGSDSPSWKSNLNKIVFISLQVSLTKLSESSLFLVAYRLPLSELSSRLNLLFLSLKSVVFGLRLCWFYLSDRTEDVGSGAGLVYLLYCDERLAEVGDSGAADEGSS